ncbi:TetR/AcrR family transcriptional regulator [Nocardia aurantiaca]|uniref:TetR family transcriptional regulator n=1 Tax=Nocardia aurantiaca TaxID=2675850 RepID=A0A6I3KNM0_9NOCA|nr:TetR/AcrR family transcriptional regulator [Nocardia aurantiaca]MTE12203.1 TetR family transcriptional regulator [Nocardia aurantiaca]
MEAAAAQPNPVRPHTGRRRNEATRQAILEASLRLLGESEGAPVTIDAIARAAGVGKQTVYRWWPSKGAVLLDALTERSALEVPTPDSGSVRADLRTIAEATFRGAQSSSTAPALRTLVREAAHDPHLAELLATFTAQRREAVRAVLARGQQRGELPADADLDLMVDQFYGVFWYRFILGHAPLDDALAERLTDSILGGDRTIRPNDRPARDAAVPR